MDVSKEYGIRREEIERRLLEFKDVWRGPDDRVFAELCFCLCTPQSEAKRCWAAVSELHQSGALLAGTIGEVAAALKSHGVRFYGTKAQRILEARSHRPIKGKIDVADPETAREWLVGNVRGLGYKEASHFLRNIGLGENLAILDRHILKNLVKLGIIRAVPKSMTRKRYLEIEKLMKECSKKECIPMAELDLLFWSAETGEVFK